MPLAHDFDTIKCINVIPWEDRIQKALFRGGATGQGVTEYDNQRIQLCAMREPYVACTGRRKPYEMVCRYFGPIGCLPNVNKNTAGTCIYRVILAPIDSRANSCPVPC